MGLSYRVLGRKCDCAQFRLQVPAPPALNLFVLEVPARLAQTLPPVFSPYPPLRGRGSVICSLKSAYSCMRYHHAFSVREGGHMRARTLYLLAIAMSLASPPVFCAADSLDESIDAAASKLVEAQVRDDYLLSLPQNAQDILKGIEQKRIRAELYKRAVNSLKGEPALTENEVRWLIEIEDGFVAAARHY